MKIKKEHITGFIGGLIGGVVATIGISLLIKKFGKEIKKSGVISSLGDEILPQNAQNIISFTMRNTTGSPQKITLFNGYSLVPIQMQNPSISISSTPSLEYLIRTLATQPLQLDRVVVKCGKSSFDGMEGYSYLALSPPVAPPKPPAPPPPVVLAPPVPPPAPAPVVPPASTANCQRQIEQPFTVDYKDASGQAQTVPIFPMVSAWQKQGNMALADMKNIVLDAQTVIRDYTVLPNTSVTMIFFWKETKKK